MLQAHSKGNGIHKQRLNGEDGPHAAALLDQPQLADEVHRLTAALRSGQIHERARLDGATPEERRLLEEFNDGLDILTTPLAYVVEWLGSVGKGELPPLRVPVGPLRKTV